jgi:hypothetical protein
VLVLTRFKDEAGGYQVAHGDLTVVRHHDFPSDIAGVYPVSWLSVWDGFREDNSGGLQKGQTVFIAVSITASNALEDQILMTSTSTSLDFNLVEFN